MKSKKKKPSKKTPLVSFVEGAKANKSPKVKSLTPQPAGKKTKMGY